MKTLKKNLLVFVICILSAVSFVLGFSMKETVKLVSAQGQQVEEFFVYGASVRAPEGEIDAAVKFHILAEENFYNENIVGNDVNVKVIVARNLAENETVLTTQNTGKVLSFPITSAWTESELKEGYVEAVAYFYGIPNNCYDVDLAVAAEVVEGGEVAYYTNQRTASLAWVAWKSGSDAFNAYRPNYTVSFDGGETVTAMYGTSFDELNVADGVKEGYTFEGWDYDATTAITGNVNVKANWSVDYTLSVDSTATVYNDTTKGAGSFDLDYKVNPELSVASAQENVTYSYNSSDTAVATVDASGNVVGKGKGDAMITVTAKDNLTGETQSQDVAVTVKNYYEISTEAEFDAIANDADGYYRMASDIAFTGNHNNTIDFKGVFDGNGKKMTGLSIVASRGLFQKLTSATVKNLSIVDVVLDNQAGTIAYSTNGSTCFIDNVYVSVKQNNGAEYVGGLIGRFWTSLEVSNSCVYFPEMANEKFGFVGGYAIHEVKLSNCVFIGRDNQITGYRKDQDLVDPVVDANTVVVTEIDAYLEENLAKLTEQNKASYLANSIFVNTKNFSEIFAWATTQTLELTKDLTLSGDYANGQGEFNGVFEGNGCTISGLKIKSATNNALFYKLGNATIKNVIFKDVVINYNQAGVLAHQVVSGKVANIQNVYVSVKSTAEPASNGRTAGALINRTWGSANVSNTVVVINDSITPTHIGFLTGDQGGCTVDLKNCVFIGPDGVPYRTGSKSSVITADKDTDIYTSAQVDDTVLAKMSDQNYKAYTGTARA